MWFKENKHEMLLSFEIVSIEIFKKKWESLINMLDPYAKIYTSPKQFVGELVLSCVRVVYF